MDHPQVLRLPPAARELRIMFLAKHARSGGRPHPEDGSHAVYHHELLCTLEGLGPQIVPEDRFEALFGPPAADFVIPLLNRAGFANSEILAPLLLTRHGTPFLGASPILRGLADDKHLMKRLAQARGVPTAPWAVRRRGGAWDGRLDPRAGRLVVKPNASSASWGVKVTEDAAEAFAHADALLEQGHDVIIEPWTPLVDVAVAVVGGRRGPWLLPPMAYAPDDPERVRSYEEKRNLVPTADDPLVPVEDAALAGRLHAAVQALLPELWPFDYGRFEFRYDPASGRALFMEVNLSCNLWSRKTISRAARLAGVDHASLVETILAHSLARQGLLPRQGQRRAA